MKIIAKIQSIKNCFIFTVNLILLCASTSSFVVFFSLRMEGQSILMSRIEFFLLTFLIERVQYNSIILEGRGSFHCGYPEPPSNNRKHQASPFWNISRNFSTKILLRNLNLLPNPKLIGQFTTQQHFITSIHNCLLHKVTSYSSYQLKS